LPAAESAHERAHVLQNTPGAPGSVLIPARASRVRVMKKFRRYLLVSSHFLDAASSMTGVTLSGSMRTMI
jgi:hypothetical protein